MNRKKFIKNGILLTSGMLMAAPAMGKKLRLQPSERITILYTNDTHSRIDPFPSNAVEYAGMGGVSRRSTLIKRIRDESPNSLLLDAGDVFEGTAWFDLFGGRKDFELMSRLGYDAMCIGEHEFVNGLDGLAEVAPAAEFPILCSNYRTENTPLNSIIERFIIREMGGLRVGIFGLGIRLNGLITPDLYGNVQYMDPVVWANSMVRSLRQGRGCDYIICLSHLGYQYDSNQMDDRKLAARVNGIDLVIGGHTHTFLDQPVEIVSPDGETTLVTQAGHSGVRLGRIDLNVNEIGVIDQVISHQYDIRE